MKQSEHLHVDRFVVWPPSLYEMLEATAGDIGGLMAFRFEHGLVDAVEDERALVARAVRLLDVHAGVVRLIVERRTEALADLPLRAGSRLQVHEFSRESGKVFASLSAPEDELRTAWLRSGMTAVVEVAGSREFQIDYQLAFDQWLSSIIDTDAYEELLDDAVDLQRPSAIGLETTFSAETRQLQAMDTLRAVRASSAASAGRATELASWSLACATLSEPLVLQALELADSPDIVYLVLRSHRPVPLLRFGQLRLWTSGGRDLLEELGQADGIWATALKDFGEAQDRVVVGWQGIPDDEGSLKAGLFHDVDGVELQMHRRTASRLHEAIDADGGRSEETLRWQMELADALMTIEATLPSAAVSESPVQMSLSVKGKTTLVALTLYGLTADGDDSGLDPVQLVLKPQDDGTVRAVFSLAQNSGQLADQLRRTVSLVAIDDSGRFGGQLGDAAMARTSDNEPVRPIALSYSVNIVSHAANDSEVPLKAAASSPRERKQLNLWPATAAGIDGVAAVELLELTDEISPRLQVLLRCDEAPIWWSPIALRFTSADGSLLDECELHPPGTHASDRATAGLVVAQADLPDDSTARRSRLLHDVDRVDLVVRRRTAQAASEAPKERLAARSADALQRIVLRWQVSDGGPLFDVQARLAQKPGQRQPVIVTFTAHRGEGEESIVLHWLGADGTAVGLAPATVHLAPRDDGTRVGSVALQDPDGHLEAQLRATAQVVPVPAVTTSPGH